MNIHNAVLSSFAGRIRDLVTQEFGRDISDKIFIRVDVKRDLSNVDKGRLISDIAAKLCSFEGDSQKPSTSGNTGEGSGASRSNGPEIPGQDGMGRNRHRHRNRGKASASAAPSNGGGPNTTGSTRTFRPGRSSSHCEEDLPGRKGMGQRKPDIGSSQSKSGRKRPKGLLAHNPVSRFGNSKDEEVLAAFGYKRDGTLVSMPVTALVSAVHLLVTGWTMAQARKALIILCGSRNTAAYLVSRYLKGTIDDLVNEEMKSIMVPKLVHIANETAPSLPEMAANINWAAFCDDED